MASMVGGWSERGPDGPLPQCLAKGAGSCPDDAVVSVSFCPDAWWRAQSPASCRPALPRSSPSGGPSPCLGYYSLVAQTCLSSHADDAPINGEARLNKRVVHFSYKNINSSYNHGEKLIYSISLIFFGCMCTHYLVYSFAAGPYELLQGRLPPSICGHDSRGRRIGCEDDTWGTCK